jgi:hypothetical protein
MNGIEKCRLLREIRKRLCEDNGLPFTEVECPNEHPGCRGTCPACELHLLSLNRMLEELKRNGKTIIYDGIEQLYKKQITEAE